MAIGSRVPKSQGAARITVHIEDVSTTQINEVKHFRVIIQTKFHDESKIGENFGGEGRILGV